MLKSVAPVLFAAVFLLVHAGAARAQIVPELTSLDEFGKCTERWEGDDCLKALRAFVARNPGQGFAAGRTVTMSLNHWAAMPFFNQALPAKGDRKNCTDDRLRLAVLSALGLPSDHPAVAAGREVLAHKCWAELAPALKKSLTAEPGGYLSDNLCPILAEKKDSIPACTKLPETAAAAPALAPWQALDPAKIAVDGPAKVYRGDEGRRVTFLKIKGQEDAYLLKFEGVRGPFNNRVLLHRERPAGLGFDFYTRFDGAEFVSVVARKGWGGDYSYEVYPNGDRGPFGVAYDEKASKAVNPKAILAEFRK
jgi:hypothetical protein